MLPARYPYPLTETLVMAQADYEHAAQNYLIALDGYLAAWHGAAQPLTTLFDNVAPCAAAEQAYKQALSDSLNGFPASAFDPSAGTVPGTPYAYGQIARDLLATISGRDSQDPGGAVADLTNLRGLVDYCSHLWNNGAYASGWPGTPGQFQYQTADHQDEINRIRMAIPGGVPIPPPAFPSVTVALVRRDFSDCTNSDVSASEPNVGSVAVTPQVGGGYSVAVTVTAGTPNTAYHFYLKCVRGLGDIQTDGRGGAQATFTINTGEVGNQFAFDSYPEGAPEGNKFQSVTVNI